MWGHTREVRQRMLRWSAPLLIATVAACGGEEPPQPTGRSMTAPATAATGAVSSANAAPVIRSVRLDPRSPEPGSTIQARVEAWDADGDAVHLRYDWSIDGRRVGARGAQLSLGRVPKGAVVEVAVVANDGRDASEPSEARVEVANRPPRVAAVRLEPSGSVELGAPVQALAEAEDPDGDAVELRYRWLVNDRPVNQKGHRLETAGLRRGDRIRVRVLARDGEDDGLAAESGTVQIGNQPPEIVSLPPDLPADGHFRYTVEARDPDGDRSLRFALAEAPEGMRIDPVLGEIEWTPEVSQVGTHTVQVTVQDGHGGEGRQVFEMTLRERVDPAPASAAE